MALSDGIRIAVLEKTCNQMQAKTNFSTFRMSDLLAADLSYFWPTHSASAHLQTHTADRQRHLNTERDVSCEY